MAARACCARLITPATYSAVRFAARGVIPAWPTTATTSTTALATMGKFRGPPCAFWPNAAYGRLNLHLPGFRHIRPPAITMLRPWRRPALVSLATPLAAELVSPCRVMPAIQAGWYRLRGASSAAGAMTVLDPDFNARADSGPFINLMMLILTRHSGCAFAGQCS